MDLGLRDRVAIVAAASKGLGRAVAEELAAVAGLARTLANEVATDGVTVNNLMPGYTRTERVVELSRRLAESEGRTPAEVIGRWEAEIPMGRIGEPREFAALAAFLASERAGYITGQSIAVDGGWIRSVF